MLQTNTRTSVRGQFINFGRQAPRPSVISEAREIQDSFKFWNSQLQITNELQKKGFSKLKVSSEAVALELATMMLVEYKNVCITCYADQFGSDGLWVVQLKNTK